MKKETKNILKAFLTGFVTISAIMILMQVLSPLLGLEVGFSTSFTLGKLQAQKVLTLSLFAPIVVGLIFALVQFVEHYQSKLAEFYHRFMKTEEAKEIESVAVHGVYGAVTGFIMISLLLMLLVGVEGSYSIPFLFKASAEESSVTGSTTVISITTVIGMIYGYWKSKETS